jgi:predicted amidohydrolase
MKTVRIAAAQTPDFREDVPAALNHAMGVLSKAEAEGAALVCFPEAFLQGYLLDEASARRHALDLGSPEFEAVLERLGRSDATMVMGMIEAEGGRLFNTAVVIRQGLVLGRYRKAHLMAGERIFDAGSECPIFEVDGLRFGINICFDMNFPEAARKIADQRASLIVGPANNMLRRDVAESWKDRHNPGRGERCRETGLWLVSADVTGERDDKVAWGPTAVLNPAGEVEAQLPLNESGLLLFDLPVE